jgi:hypothetical protein
MKDSLDLKPLVLSLFFGVLLIWFDFGDASPLSGSVGNLDHILGARLWYPTEVFLPLASIVVFLLFGKVSFDIGKNDRSDGFSPRAISLTTNVKSLIPAFLYLVLLVLIDIDDISKVLGIHSSLSASNLSPGYWLPMEAIYPVGSMIAFIAFGKACYDFGRHGASRVAPKVDNP